MREKYYCKKCGHNHFVDSKIGKEHDWMRPINAVAEATPEAPVDPESTGSYEDIATEAGLRDEKAAEEPDTNSEEEDTYYGTHTQEAPADRSNEPDENHAPTFTDFLKELDGTLIEIKTRLTGLENTITQMGANPAAPPAPGIDDFLQKLYDGPWGPTVKEIAKEIPSVLRGLTGGGSSDLARAITEQIAVKEAERISKRAAVVVDAIYSDQELLTRKKP